jgi:predicted MFS family arabinose efflux permease
MRPTPPDQVSGTRSARRHGPWSDRRVSRPADDERSSRPTLLIAVLALGATTLSLLQSVVVPVLGGIADQLDVSATAAGWVLTANLLSAAVSTPVLGRLGDTRGERPVILAVTAVVALSTLLTATTSTLPLLILSRVLQGLQFCLFPLSISVLRRELPPARMGTGMAVVSSMLAVGGVVGMVTAGLFAGEGGDYRRPFWVVFGVLVVFLGAAAWVLPSRPPSSAGRVDWWGALLLAAGLALLLLVISQGNTWGWGSPATLGCLAGSVATLAGWWVLQRRLAEPLVRPAMLTDPRTVLPNVAGVVTGVGVFVSFLVVLQYVQTPPDVAGYGFGASVLEAAVVYMLPAGIAGIVLAPVAGRVVTRVGALPTLLTGGVLGLAGFLLLAVARGQPWVVIVASTLTQVWITVAFTALPALVVRAVRRDETSVANAVNSITRAVGSAIGSAVTVVVLAAATDPATGFPTAGAVTAVCLIGVGASAAVALIALTGVLTGRGTGPGPEDPELLAAEEATARAGEWSPVSGLR